MEAVKQEDKMYDVCAELEREAERRKKALAMARLKLLNLRTPNNNSSGNKQTTK